MGLFRGIYLGIAPYRASGKTILFVVDVLILTATMIITPWVRVTQFGSLALGADLVTAFLLGFMFLVSFNAIVYFGSLFTTSEDGRT